MRLGSLTAIILLPLVACATASPTPPEEEAHNARLARLPSGETIPVYDTFGVPAGAAPRIFALDLETGAERVLMDADDGLGFALARERQDEWAPPGWIVVGSAGMNVGEGAGPTLIRASDGEAIRLPDAEE